MMRAETSPSELEAVITATAPPLAWHEVGNVKNNNPSLIEPV